MLSIMFVWRYTKDLQIFITRMNEINNDLNEKEGVNISNPYYEALPH